MRSKLLGAGRVNLIIYLVLTISAIALNSRACFPHGEDFLFRGFVVEVIVNSIVMTLGFWVILAALLHWGVTMPPPRVAILAITILAVIGTTG